MSEDNEVEQSAEETAEVEEETTEAAEEADEAETEETGEEAEETTDTEADKHRKAFEDQKRRAEKAEAELKKLRQQQEKPTPKKGKDSDERLTAAEERAANAEKRAQRAELRSLGITHPDDLAIVQKAAEELGIDPVDAAERKYVKAELEEQRELRKTRDATPAPRGRSGTGSGGNNIAKLADKVAAGGELPKDPALAEKVQNEIARRAQARA